MESHRPDTRSRADSQWGGAEPGGHQPYLRDTWTNDLLIGYHTSRTTKSSNFKHPYSIVQKVTTGPCGASVVISCSGADHKGVFKNIGKNYQQVQPASAAFPLWCTIKRYLPEPIAQSLDRFAGGDSRVGGGSLSSPGAGRSSVTIISARLSRPDTGSYLIRVVETRSTLGGARLAIETWVVSVTFPLLGIHSILTRTVSISWNMMMVLINVNSIKYHDERGYLCTELMSRTLHRSVYP